MNAAIAERLRDLLERRFVQVTARRAEYDRAERAASDDAPDEAWNIKKECATRYFYALIHYAHAFRDEVHLAGVWRLAEGLHARPKPKRQPDWWWEHGVEHGWRCVRDAEPYPVEVQHRFEPVRRFHDWVLDQLAIGASTSAVVERYARGVTLFERDTFRDALMGARSPGSTSNGDERLACVRMARWLHDQGLDPFNELQLGNGRADLVVAGGPNSVAIEAKVVREGDDDQTIRERLLGGLAQARAYADRLGHVTGYLVVFWLSDAVFLERRDEVRFGEGPVRVVVVDLRSQSPSALAHVRVLPLPIPAGAT